MIKVTTIGVVCENRTESPVHRLQKLGFNDCQVELVSMIPHSTSDSPEAVLMTNIPMNQSSEDQFFHWCQDMERKQEE